MPKNILATNIETVSHDKKLYDFFMFEHKNDLEKNRQAYEYAKLVNSGGDPEAFKKTIAENLPKNHKLILSREIDGSKEMHYNAYCIIDKESKKVVMVNAGTSNAAFKQHLYDLIEDAGLIFNKKPKKCDIAAKMNDHILKELGKEAKDYEFHYTGHSLGAVVSSYAAADMDIKLRKNNLKNEQKPGQIDCLTFENPGSKYLVESLYKKNKMKFQQDRDGVFKVINNEENVINLLSPQFGDVYHVESKKDREAKYNKKTFFGRLDDAMTKLDNKYEAFIDRYHDNMIIRFTSRILKSISFNKAANLYNFVSNYKEVTKRHGVKYTNEIFSAKNKSQLLIYNAEGKGINFDSVAANEKLEKEKVVDTKQSWAKRLENSLVSMKSNIIGK